LTLIDTNILIDIFEADPYWSPSSIASLADRKRRGPVAINDVIYAELASGFKSRSLLDLSIATVGLVIARLSTDALYLAGNAHRHYRRAGGARTSVLADFFIGAQASAEGWPIVTRDVRRYRAYFPKVTLV
jgi:predicted nucleic acid-binding protein